MKRTLWMAALALAATFSVNCKDSTPNYISFDAQAPTQTTDAKVDLPPPGDGAMTTDASPDHASSSSDASASDTPADTALAQDTASDGNASDAAGSDATSDATANDGDDGQ
jgi:hypothetical protein